MSLCRYMTNLDRMGSAIDTAVVITSNSIVLRYCQDPAFAATPNCVAAQLESHYDVLGSDTESFAYLHKGLYLGFNKLRKLVGNGYVSPSARQCDQYYIDRIFPCAACGFIWLSVLRLLHQRLHGRLTGGALWHLATQQVVYLD